jgi:hypothetical protein
LILTHIRQWFLNRQNKCTYKLQNGTLTNIYYIDIYQVFPFIIHIFYNTPEMGAVYATLYHHYDKANRPSPALQFCLKAALYPIGESEEGKENNKTGVG